jgi:hypothetical protein
LSSLAVGVLSEEVAVEVLVDIEHQYPVLHPVEAHPRNRSCLFLMVRHTQ